MTRVLIHVKGQTEENFVNQIIVPHLYDYGYEKISARLLGNTRQRDHRGGIRAWSAVRTDILNHLREDAVGRPELTSQFQVISDAFTTPEEIKDSPLTAPSKRIEALVPGYQKPLFGTLAAQHIGIDTIRAECRHFRNWLERLESWPQSERS